MKQPHAPTEQLLCKQQPFLQNLLSTSGMPCNHASRRTLRNTSRRQLSVLLSHHAVLLF
jgi:hypothetical protein